MGIQKRDTFGSHAIKMRCRYSGIRIQVMHIAVTHVVRQNDDDIRFIVGDERARYQRRKRHNDAKTNSAIHYKTFLAGRLQL